MVSPWVWAGAAGISALGNWLTGKNAAKQSQKDRQAMLDAYNQYIGYIQNANQERRYGAMGFLGMLGNMGGRISEMGDPDALREFLVEAEDVRGVPSSYLQDVAGQQAEAQKRGANQEITDALKKFDQLPGGTELALKQNAQEAAIGAEIGARSQAAAQAAQLNVSVDQSNAKNALGAASANLSAMQQANQARIAALSSLYGSAFGPLAGMLSPIVPGQMGQLPESTVGQSPWSAFGNAGMNALTLYSMMNQGRGSDLPGQLQGIRAAGSRGGRY